MNTDLTDEDRAAIDAVGDSHDAWQCAAYRAGLAAGRARAIEEAAKVCDDKRKPVADVIVGVYRQGHDDGCDRCAAAIRALPK